MALLTITTTIIMVTLVRRAALRVVTMQHQHIHHLRQRTKVQLQDILIKTTKKMIIESRWMSIRKIVKHPECTEGQQRKTRLDMIEIKIGDTAAAAAEEVEVDHQRKDQRVVQQQTEVDLEVKTVIENVEQMTDVPM